MSWRFIRAGGETGKAGRWLRTTIGGFMPNTLGLHRLNRPTCWASVAALSLGANTPDNLDSRLMPVASGSLGDPNRPEISDGYRVLKSQNFYLGRTFCCGFPGNYWKKVEASPREGKHYV